MAAFQTVEFVLTLKANCQSWPPSQSWRGAWSFKVFGCTWGTCLASRVLSCGGSVSLCEPVWVQGSVAEDITSWSLYALEFCMNLTITPEVCEWQPRFPVSAPKTLSSSIESRANLRRAAAASALGGSDTARPRCLMQWARPVRLARWLCKVSLMSLPAFYFLALIWKNPRT